MRHELPEGVVLPDLGVLVAAAADNDLEILGPPPEPEHSFPST